jgi:hypothetical protein
VSDDGAVFVVSTSSRDVVRDVAAGLHLWLDRRRVDGSSPDVETVALLASAREWLRDTPLPQSLPQGVDARPFAREYDTAQVAEVLGVTDRGARWLALRGRLPARKSSGSWAFDADAVDGRACSAGRPVAWSWPAGPLRGRS